MFDLRFYKLVNQILHNHHPTPSARDSKPLDQKKVSVQKDGSVAITVDDEDKLLRLYIKLAYAHYFDADCVAASRMMACGDLGV
jgi:hypothetical protein